MRQHALLWLLCAGAVLLLHVPYLTLPYFWDEAGYYVPAALELAQHGRLIPRTTAANPHPPLLSLYLAAAYKLFGSAPLVTRMAMGIVAGTAVYAALVLAMVLAPAAAGLRAAGLLLLCPIFFAQSTLAHLDVAATAATLLVLYFFLRGRVMACLIAATVLCLVRETGVVVIVVLALFARRPIYLIPALPLAAWFGFLRYSAGHWLGDPGFVAYNIWEALHPLRFLATLARRLHFLFVVDFRWILALPLIFKRPKQPLIWAVIGAHVLVMSFFGGAVLNRYLLPALALFFLLALRALGPRASRLLFFVVAAAQIAGWFWNPPYPFPYEENLAYVDFVHLHQAATEQMSQFPPETRILTAWPATDELTRPGLRYVRQPARVVPLEDFSEESFDRVKREDFDVVLLYSREWRPEWNLLEKFPALDRLRRALYGRRPQADPDWVRRKFNLHSGGAIRLRGQWVEWLAVEPIPPVRAALYPAAATRGP